MIAGISSEHRSQTAFDRFIFLRGSAGLGWMLLFAFMTVFAATCSAEKIEYEIYAVDEVGGTSLMAKGIRNYGDADLEVEERKVQGETHWSKSLELASGFSIGISIFREPEITGLGIWARRSPCGFSWEWFDAVAAGRFRKLQESGKLTVMHRDVGPLKEISEITFDTDVSLRLNESQDMNRITHRIVVKRGSTLKLPSAQSSRMTRADRAAFVCMGR